MSLSRNTVCCPNRRGHLHTRATLIDDIIDLHDQFMGTLFSKPKRNHADRFQQSGKAISDKISFIQHGSICLNHIKLARTMRYFKYTIGCMNQAPVG